MRNEIDERLKAKLAKLSDEEIALGKKIHCVNPKHDDKTPSMHIYHDHAVCFGCGYNVTPGGSRKLSERELIYKEFMRICSIENIENWAELRGYQLEVLKDLGIGLATIEVYSKMMDLFGKTRLTKVGLIKKNRYLFVNRIIIPHSKYYFSARSVGHNKVKNLFPSGLEKEPLIINKGKEVTAIVEGETDAIALYHISPDITIISVGGTNSAENLVSDLEFYTESSKVLLCFDNDQAGYDALRKVVPKLSDKEYLVKQIKFSTEFKDIDELHKKYGEDSLKHLTQKELTGLQIIHEDDFKPMHMEEYESIIETNFPGLLPYVKLCLSAVCVHKLEKWSNPVGIIFVGPPSGEKTTLLAFFYGIEELVFQTDNFTPRSFVTHAMLPDEELQQIDLLPKIKDKVLIISELAPLFAKRHADLMGNMANITRIFDGEGLQNDTGSKGHRGYSGEYLFSLLGATTPIGKKVWKIMGKLGTRLMFRSLHEKEKTDEELNDIVTGRVSYSDKVKICRDATHRLIKSIFLDGKTRNINLDDETSDRNAVIVITACSKILRLLRAVIELWKSDFDESYQHSRPLIEKPYRIMAILKNVAKGNAIAHGRDKITLQDVPLVVDLALDSMPDERRILFELVMSHLGDAISIKDIELKMGCSYSTAYRTAQTLSLLNILKEEDITVEQNGKGRPEQIFRVNKDLRKYCYTILPYYRDGIYFKKMTGDEIVKEKEDSFSSRKIPLGIPQKDIEEEKVELEDEETIPSVRNLKENVYSADTIKEILGSKETSYEVVLSKFKDKIAAERLINKMKKQGVIYEPKSGFLRIL